MRIPSSSAQRLEIGRVAEPEQVPEALRAAGMTAEKNPHTFSLLFIISAGYIRWMTGRGLRLPPPGRPL